MSNRPEPSKQLYPLMPPEAASASRVSAIESVPSSVREIRAASGAETTPRAAIARLPAFALWPGPVRRLED